MCVVCVYVCARVCVCIYMKYGCMYVYEVDITDVI